jgi:two-component system OmpR family response regulator
MRVLFIEDHEALAQAIGGALRRAGFAVDQVGTLLEAREALALAEYDLALLDIGLPDGSGTELIPDLREKHATPVILLTARGARGDRIEGLNSGADDYVVKPVEIPELIARCRAVLRRPGNRTSAILTAGHLLLDTVHREARRGSEVLGFSRRELGVLELLMRRKNRVVPRQLLLETIYDRDEEVSPNAIDAAVSRVRRALGIDSGVDLQTVRGVGWMLMDASDP